MRSIWKGAVSFGLVTIPISLYTATEDRDVRFHQLHKKDLARIRYKKVCEAEEEEVPEDEIVKGYEISKENYVVMEDKDFEDLPVSSSRAIEIQEFVNLPEVDPIYFQKSYYLEPQSGAAKPYALLRDAMERSNKIALAKVTIRNKEQLATVRVTGDALVMDTLFYPDEIRDANQLEGLTGAHVTEKEVDMALTLIEALSGDFEPSKYHDEYREALLERINSKAEGKPVESAPVAKPAPKVMDLFETLRASVEAAKKPEEAAPKRKTRAA
ncbi:MAG TPA: Ku protein [Chloroflexota bacterium]|nr:Ku protein [Chloroflexota bacterium]